VRLSPFVIKDNRLYACGSNYWGQLGLGDTIDRKVFTVVPCNVLFRSISGRVIHTAGLDVDDNIWGTSSNYNRDVLTKISSDVNLVQMGFHKLMVT